jgi:hypothetical protein
MTKLEQLKEALEKIGWRLRFMGVGYYQLMNDKKQPTAFRVNEYSLTCCDAKKVFGGEFKGSVDFVLEHCEITLDESNGAVNVGNQSMFVSFYNFVND